MVQTLSQKFFKRLFDVAGSCLGLLLLSPLFLIVGLLIKIDSKGPVFFRQKRVGLNFLPFFIIKFRTMRVDAAKGPAVTQKNDSRITRVGRFLRKMKIDETPQLVNVLKGEMSFVGPRPEIPALVDTYREEFKSLLSVKPGITSPATIFHRDEEEIIGNEQEIFEYHQNNLVPKKASFDLAYIENKSFFYDIKLILLTFVSVIINQSGYMRDRFIKNRRVLIIFSILVLSIGIYYISFFLRLDFHLDQFHYNKFLRTLPLMVLIKLAFFSLFGLYEGYWRYVSIKELTGIFKAITLTMLTFALIEFLFLDPAYPSGVILIDGILSIVIFSAQRLSFRFLREVYAPIRPVSHENALIIGAGDRGEAILRDIHRNPDLSMNIAGIIGERKEMGIKIYEIPVIGVMDDLFNLIQEKKTTTLIIAKEELTNRETTMLTQARATYQCKILNVPSVADIITGRINTQRLGEVKIEDLLGRKSVKLDNTLVQSVYKNKCILITGAGGSIGSELVRQIVRFAPAELLLLDKDETLLYEIETELKEIDTLCNYKTLIGNIQDRDRLTTFFNKFHPQIVIHAAAYKHVPLLELHCHDAIQNNVYGTLNLLQLADQFGIERFVMISTDKAVKPTSVMGASKRLAERMMFECIAPKSKMKCMAVRFGNVLGSRGSVIPLFKRQIERGGPLYVTHPEVTRFFMSIPEASQLVLQAGAMGRGGEVFILKMGDPIKIKDLAYRLIELAGLRPEIDIKIEYSGLRLGEKLYEELLTEIEGTVTTRHEKILVIDKEESYNSDLIDKIKELQDQIFNFTNAQIRFILKSHVPEYQPQKEIMMIQKKSQLITASSSNR